jgi:predicted  nucleic acid-binding Zn-ribbon protein
MDNTIPMLESPAIRRVRDKAEEDIEELLDTVEEFTTYVEELNDYKWRLTDEHKVFLELALELSRRLEKDAAFIETITTVFDCYIELEDTLDKKISVTKDSINLQEESLYLNMSAEEAVENRIEILEKELRPLMKRKRNLQLDIEYDVARLIRTRSSLARLKKKWTGCMMIKTKFSLTLMLPKNIKARLKNCRLTLLRRHMSLLE